MYLMFPWFITHHHISLGVNMALSTLLSHQLYLIGILKSQAVI